MAMASKRSLRRAQQRKDRHGALDAATVEQWREIARDVDSWAAHFEDLAQRAAEGDAGAARRRERLLPEARGYLDALRPLVSAVTRLSAALED